MRLPPNMFTPEVMACVAGFKQELGSFVLDTALAASDRGGSAIGIGAVAAMGMLDATLEQFVLWHRAQGLPFEEVVFLAMVKDRLALADAHCTAYLHRGNTGGVQ